MHNQFKTQKFKHLMLAMGPRDLNSAPYSPVHRSSHSMTSFQSSELTELPVVENSQLFAQRTVRPLTTDAGQRRRYALRSAEVAQRASGGTQWVGAPCVGSHCDSGIVAQTHCVRHPGGALDGAGKRGLFTPLRPSLSEKMHLFQGI